jgi:hypothetical protein
MAKSTRSKRAATKAKNGVAPKKLKSKAAATQSTDHAARVPKKEKAERPKVVGAYRILGRSLMILKRNWRIFLGITAVYGALNLLLVHGLASNGNLETIKSALTGSGKQLSNGVTLFAYMIGGSSNASSANANAGIYQTTLIILVSLVLIWTLRQVYNDQRPRIRDGFYKGVYPLVPFILVLLVMGLQLLPLAIGGLLYSTVISNGIAVHAIEKVGWVGVFVLFAVPSLYMLCSSAFALYIVTLPDMTPLKALRSARELVRHRRLLVHRKLIFLTLAQLVFAVIVMLPTILFATVLAEWLYFGLTMVALAVIHSYLYALYRELLPRE